MSDIIDINVGETIEEVTINVTDNLITVNINKVTGGGGDVASVNGETGIVVLNQDDILDGTTYKQYSLTEKNKLAGIASGAEVNVNADWNAVSGDAEILNKPTIPDATSDLTNDSGFITIGDVPTPTLQEVTDEGATTTNAIETTNSIKAAQLVTQTNGSTKSMTLSSSNLQSERTAEWQDKEYTGIADITDIPDTSTFVPYTGATANVDLGTHKLLAEDLDINHTSGSGVAASITKGGNGEALTVVKTSGSGNAASITGGVTLLDELHLTTDLADTYIASAATWNAKFTLPALTSGSVLFSNGTTIAQDNAQFFWDDTNNRLGIGTNAPAHKLHITGSFGSYTGGLLVENTGNASDAFKNVATFIGNRGNSSNIDDNTNIGILQKSNIVNNYGIVNFFNAAGNLSAFFGCQYVNHGGGQSGNFIIGTTNAGTPSEKMRISAAGLVGIGTTSPQARLDVRAQGALSTDIAFRVRNSADSANLFDVRGNGNVGIGNKTFSTYSSGGATPNDCLKLELTSDGAVLGVQNSNASGFSGVEYLNQSGAARVFTGFNNSNGQEFRFNNFASGGYIDFLISATSALRIANSRNILLGTPTDVASSKLTINSTTQGFLPPRMTTTQKNAIASPAAGLVVYDSTLGKLCVRTASAWETITSI
jgi:hypothetical protein